jgi:hypothetical protein
MAANFYPDGLTIEVITALQREVDEELRQEGYALLTPCAPWAPSWMPASPTGTRRNHRSSRRTENTQSRTPPAEDASATRRGQRRTPRQRGAQRVVA